jgi:hypothetical protein
LTWQSVQTRGGTVCDPVNWKPVLLWLNVPSDHCVVSWQFSHVVGNPADTWFIGDNALA